MSEQRLSDRLIESVKEDIQQLLNSDYIQKLLITGEMTDRNIAIAQNVYKEGLEIVADYLVMFTNALKLDITAEERQFFESAYDLWDSFAKCVGEFDRKYKKNFGVRDERVWSKPRNKENIEYGEHVIKVSKNGSVAQILGALLSGFVPLNEMWNYLERQPNFKANPIVDVCAHSDGTVNAAVIAIKSLIDSRAPIMSAKEEQELFDTFKATTAIDCEYHSRKYELCL